MLFISSVISFIVTYRPEWVEKILELKFTEDDKLAITGLGIFAFSYTILTYIISSTLKRIRIKNNHIYKFIELSDELLDHLKLTINNEKIRFNTYAESVGLSFDEPLDDGMPDTEKKDPIDVIRGSIYTHPKFDMVKLENFKKNIFEKYNYEITEPILVYFDDTVFGSGSDGAAITDNSIIITQEKIGVFPLTKIKWTEIKGSISREIILHTEDGKVKFTLTSDNQGAETFHNCLNKILKDKKIID